VKAQNSRDLNRRCRSLHDKELYLNRGEDDVKGPHAEGSRSTIDREASGSETGLGRSAQAGWPGLFRAWFATPFDLGVSL
jgi:hypothetical protein